MVLRFFAGGIAMRAKTRKPAANVRGDNARSLAAAIRRQEDAALLSGRDFAKNELQYSTAGPKQNKQEH